MGFEEGGIGDMGGEKEGGILQETEEWYEYGACGDGWGDFDWLLEGFEECLFRGGINDVLFHP